MEIKEIQVNDYLTKSNLPASDYVINPYVGCPHGCKYCYASFMKRFTGHKEEWGSFVDIKRCDKKINLNKIKNKTVFLSSVTDCYNEMEEKYQLTREILKQLINSECYLSISTKSKLILRDIDILKQIKNITVSMSINTLNEDLRKDMDNAATIKERLDTLKQLHNNGIHTILFMSPIFPYITEWKEIIEKSKDYIDEYWFENLNLRGQYKISIMNYIKEKYPQYYEKYVDIYNKNNKDYWITLAKEINNYCDENKLNYKNYFYHDELVKAKKEKSLYNEYLYLLNQNKIPDFLQKYLTVPSLNRLKNIGYFCGMDYASKNVYNFKEKLSRYDHSLTVALLTWKFTKDKKATIAGLFHDVATPCFAHVIDYMNKDYENQESTEEYTEEIIRNDTALQEYLNKDNIPLKDITDFKKYSIVDNDRPKLCADRLDGIILNGMAWTKKINQNDIHEIILDLDTYQNEYGEQEIGFKTKEIAEKTLYNSNEIDRYCHTNEDNFMMELLAKITKISIENKIITYDDLYYISEKELLTKMKESNINELTQLLEKFENITINEIPNIELKNVKIRDLNPLVNGKRLIKNKTNF